MVRVRGQIDAPLVDIGSVREGYWERKEIMLPSLARFHKTKGWFSWFQKQQVPKVVLTRLGQTDFDKIDDNFSEVKALMIKDGPALQRITNRMENGKELTEKESRFLIDASLQIRPYLLGMLTEMIIEPKMTYEEVKDMMDALDINDANSLYVIVNAMTSSRARALKHLYEQRSSEMQDIRKELGVPS